jgi:PleD family two-component response regulator
MKNAIGILIVEDVAADAELMELALLEDGLAVEVRRVDTEAGFRQQLAEDPPDLILSDHSFPSFDGFSALAIARTECPEVPFIFVTGALGEEVAIASFKQGATDYVLKDRLSLLAPAVRRALQEVEERASRRRAEGERDQLVRELQETLVEMKTLTGLLPVCALCKKIRHYQHGWQPLEQFLQQHTDAALSHELCPECAQKIPPAAFGRAGQALGPLRRAGAR